MRDTDDSSYIADPSVYCSSLLFTRSVWDIFGFKDLSAADRVFGTVIQDVVVIVAAAVHCVVVFMSKGFCEPAKLCSSSFLRITTPVSARFPHYVAAALVCLFASSVFVPSIIGVSAVVRHVTICAWLRWGVFAPECVRVKAASERNIDRK